MILKRTLPSRAQPEQPAGTLASATQAPGSTPAAAKPETPKPPKISFSEKAEQRAAEAVAAAATSPEPVVAPAIEAPVEVPAPAPVEPVIVEPALAEPVVLAPEVVAAPEPVMPEPAPLPVETAPAEETATATAAESTVAEAPVAPLETSRPDDANFKRKVRNKRPREFTSTENRPAQSSAPAAKPAVPQTDVEFDKVMERLAKLGVVDTPTDSLTQRAAPATAVKETPAPSPAPRPAPAASAAPAPAPKTEPSKPSDQPAWLAELTKELQAASPKENKDPRRAGLNLPPPPTLPSNLLAGLVEDTATPAAFTPATLAPAAAPAGGSQSNVPWASPAENPLAKEDWQMDVRAAPSAAIGAESAGLPPSLPPPGDIYGGIGKGAGSPPWNAPAAGNLPPPELPRGRQGIQSTGPGLFIGLGVVVLIGGLAWWLASSGGDAGQKLAEFTQTRPTQTAQPQSPNGMLLPPPDGSSAIATLPQPGVDSSSSAIISFADVPANEANKPIVAGPEDSEKMPEDIGMIAALQKAIAEKKAEKEQQSEEVQGTTGNPALDKTIKNESYKAKLDAELAAYRKALVDAGSIAEAPRPSEFLGKPQPDYMLPKTAATEGAQSADATLNPPPAPAGTEGLPPAQAYGNNPANLPVLAEPVTEQPKVRTLEDFDTAMFEPEREKIRIPHGIRPRMSTSDFPEMDVLSLVPNKGLIAYRNGQEGVLLVGETIDGWQLVGVGSQSAEFRNGQRSYYVSADQ